MNLVKEYALTLLSFTVTLLLTLVAKIWFSLTDEGTYIVFVIGVSVTVSATLLEKKIENLLIIEMSRKLRVYEHLEQIDDHSLRESVFKLAEGLSKGEIPEHIASLRSRELIITVKKTLQASDYTKDMAEFQQWNSARRQTWFKQNVEAMNRGVTIERHFLLERSKAIDKKGKWDKQILDVIRTHSQAGIKVRIIWLETLALRPPKRNIEKDFAIYDNKEVYVKEGTYGALMYRLPSRLVLEYKEIFEEQKKFALELEDVLSAYPE